MRCRDRLCSPEEGDEGCMAHVCNTGAFDALDFVWTSAWNDCPIAAAERKEADAQDLEDRHREEWEAMQMDSDGVPLHGIDPALCFHARRGPKTGRCLGCGVIP